MEKKNAATRVKKSATGIAKPAKGVKASGRPTKAPPAAAPARRIAPPVPTGPRTGRPRKEQPPEIRDTDAGRFGRHLFELMQAAGIEAPVLAERLGTNKSTVNNWIAATRMPPVERWREIATALDLARVNDLLPALPVTSEKGARPPKKVARAKSARRRDDESRNDDAVKFGLHLEELMRRNQIISRDLAKRLNSTPTAVSYWVSGFQIPPFDRWREIAAALGLADAGELMPHLTID